MISAYVLWQSSSVDSNSGFKPFLPWNLESRFQTQTQNSDDFLKLKMIDSQGDIIKFSSTTNNNNENALEGSYRVSYRVEKTVKKKSFIAELLCDP
jgi:hypothetical protein